MFGRLAIGVALSLVGQIAAAQTLSAPLVILAPTGATRDGLPVLTRHPHPGATLAALSRGFSGRLLHLYSLEQEFLRRRIGAPPEPAYLLLSDRQGGFPQFGFYLDDVKKADVGWVDLHRDSTLTGRFGAMDQIFPHELLHVIVHQLAGPMPEGGANQVHAVGVRTDPQVAFNEGFAEHVQIMAVDDEDASADTRALATAPQPQAAVESALAAYAHDLASRSPFPAARMRFLLWYNQTEQALRYHGVRANRFAHDPIVPPALLARSDRYPAYLFRSVIPGRDDGPPVPSRVRVSKEAVVAHLFWRVVTSPALRDTYRDDAFYAAFGTTRSQVSPLENIYLKLFVALAEGRPATALSLLEAYRRAFPDEVPQVDQIVATAIGNADLADAPELWLANADFVTGTSLFDQFRGLPRPHTFDANAASAFDWLTVPGVTPDKASALVAAAPYPRLEALQPVAGPAVWPRIQDMSEAMRALRERGRDEEETLSLWRIVSTYLGRLGVLAAIATVAGALVGRRAGVRRWWTAALVAAAATVLVIFFGWIVTGPWWLPVAAPPVLGGVPWGAWRAVRRRGVAVALAAPAAWWVAAVPALCLINLSRWI